MSRKKAAVKVTPKTPLERLGQLCAQKAARFIHKIQGLLERRPHRSFRMTRRRDYIRPLNLPGYWSFTNEVRKVLFENRRLFLTLGVLYAVFVALFVGMASQDNYSVLGEMVRAAGGKLAKGDLSELGSVGMTLVSLATGSLSTNITEVQSIFAGITGLLVWLTTVWLLRVVKTGGRPKLRDGLYNAGAPIVSTFVVGFVLLVQLLPVALVFIAYGAASSTGLLNNGVEAMVFWVTALLLTLLSVYWISSTFVALVVVTLPGMYPMQAIRTAGDLVVGRRIRILLRLLWLLFIVGLSWLAVMIPIIIFDAWIKGLFPAIEWVPVVPVTLLIIGTLMTIWSASYTYLLYRKVVDDDAAPA